MMIKNKEFTCTLDLRVKHEDDRRGGNSQVGHDRKEEQGRSMVEMLGVLAVVGVLSVGGIAGYTYAMNKHYANELLNGASKRSVLVTAQIASDREPSLSEFKPYDKVGGGEFGQEVVSYTDGVGIPVSGVKGAVCENLVKATDGTDILITDIDENEMSAEDCAEESNDLLFVFETGIGVPEDIEKACTEMQGDKPGACSKCLSMEEEGEAWWIDSDELCAAGERCHDGNCVAIEGAGCVKNSDCDEGEFCLYSSVDAVIGPEETGSCESASAWRGDEVFSGFVSNNSMDWFSAQNFCRALGTNLGYRYDVNEFLPIFTQSNHTEKMCSGKTGMSCSVINEIVEEVDTVGRIWLADLESDGYAAAITNSDTTPLGSMKDARHASNRAFCRGS